MYISYWYNELNWKLENFNELIPSLIAGSTLTLGNIGRYSFSGNWDSRL